MEIYTILLLSVGLAGDACAVAVARGASSERLRPLEVWMMAALFGLFQAGMPLLGWLIGLSFKQYISSIDHWLAFVLLGVIGGNMIYHERRKEKNEETTETIGETTKPGVWSMVALAVATSVDALVVGIGFIVLESVIFPLVSIGLVTFILCAAGGYLGHRFKHLAGKKVNSIGGAILILIGSKILIEHLMH